MELKMKISLTKADVVELLAGHFGEGSQVKIMKHGEYLAEIVLTPSPLEEADKAQIAAAFATGARHPAEVDDPLNN
jgi:hypothetical protein